MTWLREFLFGNWKNKGVALFFAVTIWFVVFQSEKQELPASAKILLLPADRSGHIITEVEELDEDRGAFVDFQGRVKILFSGPRKQIEDLKQEIAVEPLSVRLEVPKDVEAYVFREEDFGFPRQGVDIVKFTPSRVRVLQEEVRQAEIGNLSEYVDVTARRSGFEVATKRVEPNRLTIRGPKSAIDFVQPKISVAMSYSRDRFDDVVPVRLAYPEHLQRLVEETVDVIPPQVRVEIVLRATTEGLAAPEVKVAFRLPPLPLPIRILPDGLSGGTIPVEFFGPKDSVARLAERLNSASFSLVVPVPNLSLEPGEVFEGTFTEETLELYGFPDVQVRPHKSRQALPRRPWTYRIVAVKEARE